jgi:transcriptional regulator with XRE-family HTH domain
VITQIGACLKQIRESKGYSQQNVADHLGMEQPNYQKFESDKAQPKLDLLQKLADFYKVSLMDLISPEKNSVHIQNNNHNHNGVVVGDVELFQMCLKLKDEIIKVKDDMIHRLERELDAEKKKNLK